MFLFTQHTTCLCMGGEGRGWGRNHNVFLSQGCVKALTHDLDDTEKKHEKSIPPGPVIDQI